MDRLVVRIALQDVAMGVLQPVQAVVVQDVRQHALQPVLPLAEPLVEDAVQLVQELVLIPVQELAIRQRDMEW